MKLLIALVVLVATGMTARADEAAVDFARDIRPILRERCFACHAALKQEASLRVDTAAALHQGGDSGAAVVAKDLAGSVLLERISATDESQRMPPEGQPLTPEQIHWITRWIEQGAVVPEHEVPEQDPRRHWSFVKPERPQVALANGVNAIDALLATGRQSAGTTPLPPADKATLLRRVYLDLIGIPPSADAVQQFLDDPAPDAYERVVEQLLASPQHGERWARHWMDVWRYSDWYGRRTVPDVMNSYPMVWRWRDWMVGSINQDKPYDQMVREMLAADELYPADDQNVVATGYLVRSWFKWNYETWKKDLVEHTGKAFLGLTLNCAQCHDHKYDPLTQEEYFRFRAFFEPLELRHDRVPGEADPGPFKKYVYADAYGPINSGMVRVFDEQLNAETFMFAKGDSRLRMEGKPPVAPAAPAVVGGDKIALSMMTLPITAAYPGMKPFILAEERAKRQAAIDTATTELAQAQAELPSDTAEITQQLLAAEQALETATAKAREAITATGASSSSTLEGTQSLALHAVTGRRALSHMLPGIDALDPHGSVSFLVQVEQDGHTNLQLGLDIAQGATGGYVAFENGQIKTYQPGGFVDFVAGQYDMAKGQTRFRVEMQLDLPANQFLLTVTSLHDQQVLVNRAAAALNGWQPVANGKRGLFIDCRPGTKAVYDAICFQQPDGGKLLEFDFEAPLHLDGSSVTSAGGWMDTSASAAPATATVVSALALNPEVQAATARVADLRQQRQLPDLVVAAATAKLAAATHELHTLNARISADAARYASGLLAEDKAAEPAVQTLIHVACQQERETAIAVAEATLATATVAVVKAEIAHRNPPAGADAAALQATATALQTAQQQQTAAQVVVATARAALGQPLAEYAPLSPKYPQQTTGRRAALAQWIASDDNPLTARVAINHIWLRHFGQAIVATPQDFGLNGSLPTQPELLDWLACELMESGWSMKRIHRLIVTSNTYRMASAIPRSSDVAAVPAPALLSLQRDPENHSYWRFPVARMQAEVVRDSLLSVAEELDPTQGGHEIDHKQGLTSRRRSIYFAYHGEEKMEFLELFDAANPFDCYKRGTSIQPQQALALTNSELTKLLSRQLATRLWEKVASVTATGANAAPPATDPAEAFVRRAFLQVLNRPPTEKERTASLAFLVQQAARLQTPDAAADLDPHGRARANLIHALMNHNDFVTIR